MQQLNCLILEDEPLAANVLKSYIADYPGLNVIAVCDTVFSASEALRQHKADVLFVDINLPQINGLDFIRALKDTYHIILTTAYQEFALEGYNLNVTDYLLKPIERTRFLQAMNKVFGKIPQPARQTLNPETPNPFRFFNVDKKQIKVHLDEILYMESLKDYVKIYRTTDHLLTRFPISEMEQLLDDSRFIRIHKSYLVNFEKITAISAGIVEIGKTQLPLGRTYKEEVKKKFPGTAP